MNLTDSVQQARSVKAMTVADDSEFRPILMAGNAEGVQLIAVGGMHHPAVETVTVGGQMLGVIPDASELVLVSDAYMGKLDKETDDRPAPGEYQRRWSEGDRDGITECLMHVRAWRDDDGEVQVELIQDPYVAVGGTVQFEDDELKQPQSIEGRIPDALVKAFEAPSLVNNLDYSELDMSEVPEEMLERVKELIPLALVTALAGRGGGGMLVSVTDDEAEKFKEMVNTFDSELGDLLDVVWKIADGAV